MVHRPKAYEEKEKQIYMKRKEEMRNGEERKKESEWKLDERERLRIWVMREKAYLKYKNCIQLDNLSITVF